MPLLCSVPSHWLWTCILIRWLQITIFSFVRYLHLTHCPERAVCKSYSLYEELHGKDFCGRNSDLNPRNTSSWEECCVDITTFISSDVGLNINIGILSWENEKSCKHGSNKKCDSSISNYRRNWFKGMGVTALVLRYLEIASIRSGVLYTSLDSFSWIVYLGGLAFACEGKV